MTRWALRIGRFAFLVVITLVASGVMWWVSRKGDDGGGIGSGVAVSPPPTAAAPSSLVYVTPVKPEWRDVTIRYSGKIRPWETYTLGFETAGRVAELGRSSAGRPLDDGDRVEAGQVLARLDDRILRARKSEAVAQYELAVSDLQRSRRIRERSPDALAEADYQNDVTQVALAKAMQEIALKNLEDTELVAPVSGSIVRRLVEPGESVNPHEPIFEVVENDRLRLVVNVPESRVRELEVRRRRIHEISLAQHKAFDQPIDEEDRVFRARVRLEGTDVFGRPWPPINAEVHHIAQTAHDVTGMFEVEVMIPNGEGLLRPGMVATAEIVTDRLLAYAVPESAVLFRNGKTYVFTAEAEPADMRVMFWDVEQTTVMRSRRVELTEWVDQGDHILIPSGSTELKGLITRGQQRLRDGQQVRVASESEPGLGARVADRPQSPKPDEGA